MLELAGSPNCEQRVHRASSAAKRARFLGRSLRYSDVHAAAIEVAHVLVLLRMCGNVRGSKD
eukprot:5861434-Pyramimonas_sp.AAC.2